MGRTRTPSDLWPPGPTPWVVALLASGAVLAGCAGPRPGDPAAPGADSGVAPASLLSGGGAAGSGSATSNLSALPADGSPGAGGGADAGSPAGTDETPSEDDSKLVSGWLTTRYIERHAGSAHDRDLYTLLETNFGDPEKNKVTGYVLARGSLDLDGNEGQQPFASIEDASSGGSADGRLYQAYVDIHGEGPDLLRFGRQELWETPAWVRFDGAQVSSRTSARLRPYYGVYAGVPVHEYESSDSGDQVAGGWLGLYPWEGGRIRADAMHLNDQTGSTDQKSDIYRGQVAQQLGTELSVLGDYSMEDTIPREYNARVTWMRPEDGWLVQGRYHDQMSTVQFDAQEIDPFYQTLTELLPFRDTGVLATKSFEDQGFDVSGGLDYRRLKHDADATEYNREFDRYHGTVTVHDVGVKDLAVSVTGERWTSDGSEYDTWGLDVTREWSKTFRASIGSFYNIFKNDFLIGEERQNVRTYYLNLKYRPEERLTWSFGLENEDADTDNYTTITAKASWRF